MSKTDAKRKRGGTRGGGGKQREMGDWNGIKNAFIMVGGGGQKKKHVMEGLLGDFQVVRPNS